jgi:uncharacterized protein YceK
MKISTFYNWCLVLLFFILIFMMLNGCTQVKTTTIVTNKFTQTDYNYHCLDGTKTFTQIIVCYQTQDKAEKAQNKITNELIKQSQNNEK